MTQLQNVAAQGAGRAGGPAAMAGGGRGGQRGATPETNDVVPDFAPRTPYLPRTPAEEEKGFILPPGYRMELVASDPDLDQPRGR